VTAETTFEVLAEPHRRRILDLLQPGERSVGELVTRLGMSQPGVSKHLRVLREAGLVAVRRDAQRRWYSIRPEPLAEIDAWLAPYRRFWRRRLDALERHLDEQPDRAQPDQAQPDRAQPDRAQPDQAQPDQEGGDRDPS
jgi:DNA-binding transcriptional ArsR family regulator